MCEALRYTDRRGRAPSPETRLRMRRRRIARRSSLLCCPLMLCRPRCLTGLTTDVPTLVLHALALVGLGRTETADVRRDLSDEVLVEATDVHPRRALGLDRDSRRRLEQDRVRESELEH